MKIAIINENSQASKNTTIYEALNKVVSEKQYEIINYGMYGIEGEKSLTYVQVGLLVAILLNSKAVDFVITGCGTGQGAMLACNAFPNVLCGLVADPLDAYLFSQINDGNAISIPFAKGFGWGSEKNLEYIFEKLFSSPFGGGYPKERALPEQKNKQILDSVKMISHTDMLTILKRIDHDFLKETISIPSFKKYFFQYSQNEEMNTYLHSILEERE